MAKASQFLLCPECGTRTECDHVPTYEDAHLPCPRCGSRKRTVNATIEVEARAESGIRGKAFHAGESQPFAEFRAKPSTKRATGERVFHERTINRAEDRYMERVTLKKTGEVIHLCEEPLSKHTGHGSAAARPSKHISPSASLLDSLGGLIARRSPKPDR